MTSKLPPPHFHNAPLFHKLYSFYKHWYERSKSFPKKDRFTIGQKIEEQTLETLVLITRAYHTKNSLNKKSTLEKASTGLESIKILIRLAKDVKVLEEKWYIQYELGLNETGKMLGGWINSI